MYGATNKKNDKEHLAQAAENMYQRAYHDLSFHIDQIEDELGKTMAMNSQRQLSPALADVWRVTSLAEKKFSRASCTRVEHGRY